MGEGQKQGLFLLRESLPFLVCEVEYPLWFRVLPAAPTAPCVANTKKCKAIGNAGKAAFPRPDKLVCVNAGCLSVDLELVRKYNVSGPRYTSYPPATKFTEEIAWADIAREIEENNLTTRDLSLYFHIPFCESLCWYCGCTTVIGRDHARSRVYLEHLQREVAWMRSQLNPRRQVTQLHWGGGSPTFLQPDEIQTLGGLIHENFAVADSVEASVEVDPRRLTRDHLAALREVGFNRVSIGVQDFDESVQKAVNRIQPRRMTEHAVQWARELGFTSINFDLIYGLPKQTVASFNRTLDGVLELRPDRLAVFNYAHVPWVKPAQRILENCSLPAPEVKLQLLQTIIERLTGEGDYTYIGMDHFARSGDELAVAQRRKTLRRNFQGYSTHGEADIYSFGMSSISQVPGAYWQNDKELREYYARVDAGQPPFTCGYLLTTEDVLRREVIMKIMCDLALDFADISRRFGVDFATHFEAELARLETFKVDGLVTDTATGFEVTDLGRLFLRNLAMCFDEALYSSDNRKFSRAI